MRYINFRAVFLAFFIGIFASSMAAQTTHHPKPKAKPLATPLATPAVLTGAEIISQAGGDDAEPVPTPLEQTPANQAASDAARIKELNAHIKKLEGAHKMTYDDRQKRVLMNLDILTRAEQRAENLRKQVFEMSEKENAINARMEQIDYEIRPEVIERTLQNNGGSMRPEEVRELRRKSLTAEKTNLQALLTQVQSSHAGLQASLVKAEDMVEKLRVKAEKDIDDEIQQNGDEPEK